MSSRTSRLQTCEVNTLACEAPPNLVVLDGEPEDFGNNEEDAKDKPEQFPPPPHQQYPSIGILRDRHKMRTKSSRVCKYYPQGKCSLGYCCNYKHLESEAPAGWSFGELDNHGDIRGIPVANRQIC